jgi:hypothetical protein
VRDKAFREFLFQNKEISLIVKGPYPTTKKLGTKKLILIHVRVQQLVKLQLDFKECSAGSIMAFLSL